MKSLVKEDFETISFKLSVALRSIKADNFGVRLTCFELQDNICNPVFNHVKAIKDIFSIAVKLRAFSVRPHPIESDIRDKSSHIRPFIISKNFKFILVTLVILWNLESKTHSWLAWSSVISCRQILFQAFLAREFFEGEISKHLDRTHSRIVLSDTSSVNDNAMVDLWSLFANDLLKSQSPSWIWTSFRTKTQSLLDTRKKCRHLSYHLLDILLRWKNHLVLSNKRTLDSIVVFHIANDRKRMIIVSLAVAGHRVIEVRPDEVIVRRVDTDYFLLFVHNSICRQISVQIEVLHISLEFLFFLECELLPLLGYIVHFANWVRRLLKCIESPVSSFDWNSSS